MLRIDTREIIHSQLSIIHSPSVRVVRVPVRVLRVPIDFKRDFAASPSSALPALFLEISLIFVNLVQHQ